MTILRVKIMQIKAVGEHTHHSNTIGENTPNKVTIMGEHPTVVKVGQKTQQHLGETKVLTDLRQRHKYSREIVEEKRVT